MSLPDPSTDETAGNPAPNQRRWIFLALLLLLGVVVYLPALRADYLLDDYLHAAMIDGTYPVRRSPLDLYNFISDVDREVLSARGLLPWWTHPELTIRFFRPLPSLLLWADHRLLGRGPVLLHLHSMLWWVAVVLAARSLLHRLLPDRPAKLATVIFALSPAHALPLAWLANREALVSLSFGLLGLGAHLRFREERSPRHAWFAAGWFALSMSGGEYSMCTGGYVLAYEIARSREAILRRFGGLFTFLVPAAVYLALRAKLGYGTRGSGFYSDPFREPAAFLGAAPKRFLTLLAQGWLTFETETLRSTTPWWIFLALTAIALWLFVGPMRRAFASLDDSTRSAARFLLLGSFLALAPVLAVVPSPRLLGAPMLGIAAAVALLLERAWFPPEPEERRGLAERTQVAALALGFAHLVHGPGSAWLTGRYYHRSSTDFAAQARELRTRFADQWSGEATRADAVVLRGMGGSFFMPFAIDPRGVAPVRWRILTMTGHVLVLRRDARTFDIISPRDTSVFPAGSGNLFRDQSSPIHAGASFDLGGMRVTVLETGPAGPRSLRCQVDRDIESAELAWLTETAEGFPAATVPRVGYGQPFDP